MLGLLTDYCYVYKSSDTARENLLLKHATSYGFGLFPDSYTLVVNNSLKTVDVQEGDNEFPVGIVEFSSGSLLHYCYVYDSKGNFLLKHVTSYGFGLFPGNYRFTIKDSDDKVIGSMAVEVQAGENIFSY